MQESEIKYEIAVRGEDVKVRSRLLFGPWHSVMYGVYTRDDILLGYFGSCAEALEYALSRNHRVLNILSVLLVIADGNWRARQFMRSLPADMLAFVPKQPYRKLSGI